MRRSTWHGNAYNMMLRNSATRNKARQSTYTKQTNSWAYLNWIRWKNNTIFSVWIVFRLSGKRREIIIDRSNPITHAYDWKQTVKPLEYWLYLSGKSRHASAIHLQWILSICRVAIHKILTCFASKDACGTYANERNPKELTTFACEKQLSITSPSSGDVTCILALNWPTACLLYYDCIHFFSLRNFYRHFYRCKWGQRVSFFLSLNI